MTPDLDTFLKAPNWQPTLEEVAERVNNGVVMQKGVPTYHDKLILKGLSSLRFLQNDQGIVEQLSVEELDDLAIKSLFAFLKVIWSNRYQTHADRILEAKKHGPDTELSPQSQGVGGCLQWKGRPLVKTVFDFALIPLIIAEIKPRTIIEIGSGSGASALWMADLLESNEVKGRVISIDTKKVGIEQDGVTFLQGDALKPGELLSTSELKELEHPWLIVDDAHVTMNAVMTYLNPYLLAGDYIYIEDSANQQANLARFLMENSNTYLVDTRYTDFFGRNATSARNSILVKMNHG